MVSRCYIDAVATGGMVGWAVGARQAVPCRLRIELAAPAPTVLGHAVAQAFRRDLLAAGIGHGHHGFTARFVAPLPPGDYRFALIDLDGGELAGNTDTTITVAAAPPPPPMRVEALLEPGEHWVEADLLAHAALLRLEANMAAMGIARFVDVTFRYVLNRWADPEGGSGYERALRTRELSAEAFFHTLLRSEERQRTPTPLVSPYDPQFPYVLD